jgi:outer membrane protein assembly factor BamB
MVIACAPKREPVYGIPGGGNGPVQAAWKFSEFPSDCVTPLYYRDRLYVLDGDRQRMTCLDPKTGEKQGQVALGVREIIRASPTGADGKIYCITEGGTAIVLAATEEMNILATIPLGEAPVRSSVVAARGRLFIRTSKNLFCFGGK